MILTLLFLLSIPTASAQSTCYSPSDCASPQVCSSVRDGIIPGTCVTPYSPPASSKALAPKPLPAIRSSAMTHSSAVSSAQSSARSSKKPSLNFIDDSPQDPPSIYDKLLNGLTTFWCSFFWSCR